MYPLLVTSMLLGWAVFFICAWLVKRPKNLPPGPWSIPLIGYVQIEPGLSCEHFTKLSRQYGPIFSLRRGTRLVVVLNDKHTITEALVKNPDVFSDRYVPASIQVHIPETDKTGKVVLPASPFIYFLFVDNLYRRVHLLGLRHSFFRSAINVESRATPLGKGTVRLPDRSPGWQVKQTKRTKVGGGGLNPKPPPPPPPAYAPDLGKLLHLV